MIEEFLTEFQLLTSVRPQVENRTLRINRTPLEYFPPTAFHPDILHFDLSQNMLRGIDGVLDWRKIRTINLEGNRLRSIPEEIVQLENLTSLRLGGNQLVELPDLSSLKRLYVLDIRENQLGDLPDLPNSLETLTINHNQLGEIPETVLKLPNLRHLNITSNEIFDLPDLGSLKSLQTLDLSFNKIAIAIHQFKDLPRLQQISLYANQLSFIPFLPPSIKVLKVGLNHITDLPVHLENLPELRELWVGSNELRSLPNFFSSFHLDILDIGDNFLTTLPNSLWSQHLQMLIIKGNPELRLSEEDKFWIRTSVVNCYDGSI